MALLDVAVPKILPLVVTPPSGFTANFALTENPISDSGNWGNTALDWGLVRTSGGKAFGVSQPSAFGDPFAQLVTWTGGPSFTVTATVSKGTTSGLMEIELHRSVISPHNALVHEVTFAHDGSYVQAIRWPGTLGGSIGDFTYVWQSSLPGPVNNGDDVRAIYSGRNIAAYINRHDGNGWVLIASGNDNDSAADPIVASGKPGFGFYGAGGTAFSNFAFSALAVT